MCKYYNKTEEWELTQGADLRAASPTYTQSKQSIGRLCSVCGITLTHTYSKKLLQFDLSKQIASKNMTVPFHNNIRNKYEKLSEATN